MKNLITTLLVLLSLQLMAQDTIVFRTGKVEEVKILSWKKESNLIVYISSNDTIYSNLLNFDKIVLHSKLEGSSDPVVNTASISKRTSEVNIKRSGINKYNYGQFSVSTNLTALFPNYLAGGRVTIEPEYRINELFSVKLPISIGIPRNTLPIYPLPDFDSQYLNYSTRPVMFGFNFFTDLTFGDRYDYLSEDIIVQIGVNPKYYPIGKSKKFIAPYLSGAVNFGIAKNYGKDYYVQSDTFSTDFHYNPSTGNYNYYWNTYWNTTTEFTVKKEGERNYFNFELLLGLDFNLSKRLTATLETGYASRLQEQGVSTLVPKVYQRIGDGEYNLVNAQEVQNFYKRHNYYKFRILLTYHF
jgi:hypothetical protein